MVMQIKYYCKKPCSIKLGEMENRRGMMRTLENPFSDLLIGISGRDIRENRGANHERNDRSVIFRTDG